MRRATMKEGRVGRLWVQAARGGVVRWVLAILNHVSWIFNKKGPIALLPPSLWFSCDMSEPGQALYPSILPKKPWFWYSPPKFSKTRWDLPAYCVCVTRSHISYYEIWEIGTRRPWKFRSVRADARRKSHSFCNCDLIVWNCVCTLNFLIEACMSRYVARYEASWRLM